MKQFVTKVGADCYMALAIEHALNAHGEQQYAPGVPYFIHLVEVDNYVTKMFKPKGLTSGQPYSKEAGDEMDNLRAVGFLHDIVEDTDMTLERLSDIGFSSEIVDAVAAITKVEDEPYNVYIAKVSANSLARKVKLCDTAANLTNSLNECNVKRINKYTKQIQLLGGFPQ